MASLGVKFTNDISLSLDCDESDDATDAFACERMEPLLAFLRDDPGRDEDFAIDFDDVLDVAESAAAAAAIAETCDDGDKVWGRDDRRVMMPADELCG